MYCPPTDTEAVEYFLKVKFEVETFVDALAQSLVVQLAPGVGGEDPPVESIDT